MALDFKKNISNNMLIPTKIQIDKNIYEFIKQVHKELHYKSLSEYIRVAVNARVEKDRKRLEY